VIQRYKKPESTKILLLFPCSAKKPYFFSKTHKLFRDQLFKTRNPNVVHELIITSPIGLVPRELELVYPASSYDIPVTGFWDEDEKKMIRTLLKSYLKNNKYDKIIVHLPKEITEFIKDLLKNPVITCVDRPTSKKSLEKLANVLNENTEEYEKVKLQIRSAEDFKGLASYQFGEKIAKKLMENTTVKGKYPNRKILEKNRQLGMIVQDRGFISLTLYGAYRIKGCKAYWVEIFNDFELIGSVFAPGVKNADEQIRVGDEVIILRKNKLCAVGVAMMNGEEMIQSTHGEAVKIRHRV
jgi:archaeosine synthase